MSRPGRRRAARFTAMALVTGALLASCRSAPRPRTSVAPTGETGLTMTVRADRDTLLLGDTLRLWAVLRNGGSRAVTVRYTSNCKFYLRVSARAGTGGTLVPGRICRLDLIVGPLLPGAVLADTLRWDGHWSERGGGGPPPAPVPAGEYDVTVAFTVDACAAGRTVATPSPGCEHEVRSAPARLTVVGRAATR